MVRVTLETPDGGSTDVFLANIPRVGEYVLFKEDVLRVSKVLHCVQENTSTPTRIYLELP